MGQYSEDFILTGKNEKAVFSLKIYPQGSRKGEIA
ncbi:hypothetical protein PGA7_00006520 [Porphyromonas gingivalis]|nr:hypothetical protein PGA7_00006520 [Porphyromonas gingivalis]